METLRIIEHGSGHTDIEALIFGEWVVVKCIQQEQNMVRIHWKVKDSRWAFFSHPMTREAAITKAAEMRQDPDLYEVEIRED